MTDVKKDGAKLPIDEFKEIARKYGVEVIDATDRGIQAIGFLGGISGKYHKRHGNESE